MSDGIDVADHETIDLALLSREVVEAFQVQPNCADVEVTFHASTETLPVRGDRVMLKEALLNLLTNSITHGGERLSQVDVSVAQEAGKALLTVADDGIGIPADKQLVAMSRFGQVNGGVGSGLGLPIASRIAESHGGRLEVLASESGAAIRISLPSLVRKR